MFAFLGPERGTSKAATLQYRNRSKFSSQGRPQ
jgi:hypothetical protein